MPCGNSLKSHVETTSLYHVMSTFCSTNHLIDCVCLKLDANQYEPGSGASTKFKTIRNDLIPLTAERQ